MSTPATPDAVAARLRQIRDELRDITDLLPAVFVDRDAWAERQCRANLTEAQLQVAWAVNEIAGPPDHK